MNNKVLSYGLNIVGRTLNGEKYIIDKYQDWFDSIFITPSSLDTGLNATCRDFSAGSIKDTENIIDFARERNIKVDIAINDKNNGQFMTSDQLAAFLPIIEKAKPEEITCLDEYIDFFRKNYPDTFYMRSFSSGYFTDKILEENKFNCYIPRHYQMWSKDVLQHINDIGAQIRILLNNGCPQCQGCLNHVHTLNDCRILYRKEMERLGIEKFLAFHNHNGKDIQLYRENFKDITFKIATRNRMRVQVVDDYIHNLITAEPIENYLNCLDNFDGIAETFVSPEYFHENPEQVALFDYNKYKAEKLRLWQTINSNIEAY